MKNGTPTLVDQFGRGLQPQASSWQFFEGADRWRNLDWQTLWYWQGAQDTDKLLPASTRKDALSSSRWVLANFPLIRGALMEQTNYSFPLEPHYRGTDKDWGRVAKKWLRQWKMNSDVRGQPYDCQTAARIRLLGRKTDGDIGRILTFDPANDYPRLQFVRSHRIQTVGAEGNRVSGGDFAGRRIFDGVIVDDVLRPLAYRVVGDRDANGDLTWQDVPASSFILTFNPDYSDQARGIPEMLAGLPTITDTRRWNDNELRAQQLQSQNAITEENEEGEAPPGGDYSIQRISGLKTEQLENGLTRYYRAGSGSKLNLLRPDRPGPGCMEFWDRIITALFYGLEWDPFFALAIKEPGGAWARTIIQKVRKAIQNNQRIEARAQLAEDSWALSRAVYKLKILPKPKDGDVTSWDYSGPALITADSGNDENAKREKYKIGILTLQSWAAEDGSQWEDIREQKEVEVRDLLTRAEAVQADFPELSLQECLSLLEQRTPNGVTAPAPAPGEVKE